VSKGAREAVEKAGGSIELIERKNPAELAAAKKGKVREARLADRPPSRKRLLSVIARKQRRGNPARGYCFRCARNDGKWAYMSRRA
jgi:hypothetical protein